MLITYFLSITINNHSIDEMSIEPSDYKIDLYTLLNTIFLDQL